MTWQRKPRRPVPGAVKGNSSDNGNRDASNLNANQSLAVDLSVIAEGDFTREVMRQLPGLPEPRIVILLMPPRHPVELDAQNLANEHGEPVAIVDMEAKLLAYRVPE